MEDLLESSKNEFKVTLHSYGFKNVGSQIQIAQKLTDIAVKNHSSEVEYGEVL